jgi:hypothetical protein
MTQNNPGGASATISTSVSQAMAAVQARTAICHLTIEDARKAKAAIEAELGTWPLDHPYANLQIRNLSAIVGAPGVMTWLAHFHESYLQDIVFEIDDDRVSVAAHMPFLHYQFQQDPAAIATATKGGEA